MWAVLGDIEFELTNHPTRQDERTSVDYAEHPLIQGKPRLEWVGDGLDELNLELLFHAALTDPEAQIRRLKAAMRAHEPLPYVLGSGDYRGIYLLTAVDTNTRKTTDGGRLISATVSVTLREYSGQYKKPLPLPRGLRNNLLANPEARIGGAAQPMATPTQKALGMARTAGSLLRAGVETYRQAKSLGGDPVALLGQAPRLLSLTGQILAPLEGLQTVAGLMEDGADLVQLGASAASEVRFAQGALNPPSLETIVSQVDYAAGRVQQAMTQMDGAAPRLARMAAAVITRRA